MFFNIVNGQRNCNLIHSILLHFSQIYSNSYSNWYQVDTRDLFFVVVKHWQIIYGEYWSVLCQSWGHAYTDMKKILMNTQKHHQTVSIEFLNIALYCWKNFYFTHKVQKLIVPKCNLSANIASRSTKWKYFRQVHYFLCFEFNVMLIVIVYCLCYLILPVHEMVLYGFECLLWGENMAVL